MSKIKKSLSLTALLIFIFVISAFAGDTGGEELSIDLGGVKLEMVKISAGPVTKEFYIGKFELTQQQWTKIMGTNPSSLQAGGAYPVENVSWTEICGDGDGFLKKINELKPSGRKGFRLPTEAEWEYACRAGSSTKFYFGNDDENKLIDANAWYVNNSSSTPHPVGQKKPNAFGLYDMSGNVSEWCSDYSKDQQGLPVTESSATLGSLNRVTRGGTCESEPKNCGSASRVINDASDRFSNVGFRLALSL